MPIHRASVGGNERTVKLLLNTTLDVDTKDDKGLSALHYASFVGHEKIISLLIDAGANIDMRINHYSVTPLLIAAEQSKYNSQSIYYIGKSSSLLLYQTS